VALQNRLRLFLYHMVDGTLPPSWAAKDFPRCGGMSSGRPVLQLHRDDAVFFV